MNGRWGSDLDQELIDLCALEGHAKPEKMYWWNVGLDEWTEPYLMGVCGRCKSDYHVPNFVLVSPDSLLDGDYVLETDDELLRYVRWLPSPLKEDLL